MQLRIKQQIPVIFLASG